LTRVKVSLVQDAPVAFDKFRTFKKVAKLVEQEASRGAQLILFPESFVPGYPRGLDFGTRVGLRTESGRKSFEMFYNNSFDLENDGPWLIELSRKHQVYIVLGVTEKTTHNGTLYCSMIYTSPHQGILGVHRKIKPTAQERVIWGEGDGKDLVTFDTAIGRLGGLICWENYMPLARQAMYNQGIQIFLAPTADARETWTATMKHVALEGRCFVLSCNQFSTIASYPSEWQKQVKETEAYCRGGTMVVSPLGEVLAGPLFDEPGILTVDIDLAEIVRGKMDLDPNGHYQRPDIFGLSVLNQPSIKKEDR
jgi:nitrilase